MLARLVSAFVLVVCPLAAQTTEGRLSGWIRDAAGASIPAVEVVAKNIATGLIQKTETNYSGSFLLASLPTGVYQVTVSHAGFRQAVYEEVRIEIGARLTLNIALALAERRETVTVNAEAESSLGYATASVGGIVSARSVLELPLAARDALGLVLMQAGVVGDNVTGSRIGTLNIQIDGIDVQDGRINSGIDSTIFPSTDRIEEFRVITSPVDAELGRGSAQIQMATRSGTNQLHGSIFNFHRNTVLNANTWFNNQRGTDARTGEPLSPRNILIRNQFGARLGGPVVKNRTFFHLLYEGQRIRRRTAVTQTVLTEPARRGVFRFYRGVQNGNAESSSPVVDVAGNPVRPPAATEDLQSVSLFDRDPFRGSPDGSGVIARQLQLTPLPNNFRRGDGLNTAGFTWSRPESDDRDQFNLKVDHVLTPRHRLSFSWSRDSEDAFNAFLPQYFPNTPGGDRLQRDNVYSLTLTSTLRPNLVSDWRAGALRPMYRFHAPWEIAPAVLPVRSGQPYVISYASIVDPINQENDPQGRLSPNYQFSEKVSWLHGRHTLKFGGQVWFVSTNGFNAFDVLPRVTIGAGGAPVRNIDLIPGIGRNQALAQNILLNLAGSVGSVRQAFNSPGGKEPLFLPGEGKRRTWKDREFALFLQDDLRVSKSVTLHLGLRYEYYGVPYDRHGLTAALAGGSSAVFGLSGTTFADLYQPGHFAGAPSRVELVGPGSTNPSRSLYARDLNNWAPVAGVAYRRNQTVFRAGYSIGYERNSLRLVDVVAGDLPGLRSLTTVNSASALNLATLSLPLTPPGRVLEEVPLTDRTQILRTFDSGLRTPYVQNWNATIERNLRGRFTVSMRYVASKGTRLIRGTSVNEHNIFENGLLDAFRTTQGGGTAPLFDRLLGGLNVPGVGVVDGVRLTGSQVFRRNNATTQGYLANNNVGAFAAYLNSSTYLTNSRGGLLRNGGLPENWIVANPQFDSARLTGNFASSTYHSLQLESIKRFTRGWMLQANYTFSKALGEEEGAGQEMLDSYRSNRNWRLDKRLLSFHRTHVVRSNALWEVPFAKGLQIGSIFNIFSGEPFSITTDAATLNNSGDNTATAAIAVDKGLGQLARTSNGVVYFPGLRQTADPSVGALSTDGNLQARSTLRAISDARGRLFFVNPAPGALGALAPRFLEGPGTYRLDLNAMKSFRLHERVRLQLEAILESAFNHARFGNPNSDMNSLDFGRITSADQNRVIVVAARLLF